MKLIVILLTASFLQVSASGFAQNINISVKDAPLKSIFKKLRKQSNYNFLYDSDMLDRAKPVSLSLRNARVEEVLARCFENQVLTYTINENTVVVKLKPVSVVREVIVKGKVNDQAGVGLPGVTIKVKGTNTGAVSNTDGSFSLKVNDPNSVLIFSYLGFASQEVELNGRLELTVVMLTKPSALDEVVVIGYGTQRKGDITGAISSVSADKLKDQSVVNLQGALQGKTAGVQITQNSGAPGSVAQVRIRGLTSINNSDPLYVVDGIPLTSNDINIIDPANIESIDILKDASAQAIYGSRGANGVILVKTKKGSDGEAVITLSTYQGATQVRKTLDMVSAADYVMLNNEAYTNAGRTSPFAGPPSSYTSTTDWQKELFRTARMQNYNVSISGGSKTSTYRVSGGYLDQDGTIIGSDYKRVNLSNNLTFTPKKGLEFGESLAFNKSRSHNVATDFGGNIINDALALDPTIPVKDQNGNFTATKYSDIINPLARINYISDNNPYNQW